MDFTEKRIESKVIMDGQILKFKLDTVLLPNGKEATREIVEHPGAVAVAAVDDQGRICMVRQYRYPVGMDMVEIPAGKLDKNEAPLDCARRELEEEAGLSASNWELLYTYYTTPGFSDEIMYLYKATGLSRGESHPDEDEFLEVMMVSREEALEMLKRGDIKDSKTIIGILSVCR